MKYSKYLLIATTLQVWDFIQADELAPKFWAAGGSGDVVSSEQRLGFGKAPSSEDWLYLCENLEGINRMGGRQLEMVAQINANCVMNEIFSPFGISGKLNQKLVLSVQDKVNTCETEWGEENRKRNIQSSIIEEMKVFSVREERKTTEEQKVWKRGDVWKYLDRPLISFGKGHL